MAAPFDGLTYYSVEEKASSLYSIYAFKTSLTICFASSQAQMFLRWYDSYLQEFKSYQLTATYDDYKEITTKDWNNGTKKLKGSVYLLDLPNDKTGLPKAVFLSTDAHPVVNTGKHYHFGAYFDSVSSKWHHAGEFLTAKNAFLRNSDSKQPRTSSEDDSGPIQLGSGEAEEEQASGAM